MSKMFLVNEETGKKYEIVDLDPEGGTITLKGERSTFTEPFDKARLKKLGYKPVKETSDA